MMQKGILKKRTPVTNLFFSLLHHRHLMIWHQAVSSLPSCLFPVVLMREQEVFDAFFFLLQAHEVLIVFVAMASASFLWISACCSGVPSKSMDGTARIFLFEQVLVAVQKRDFLGHIC